MTISNQRRQRRRQQQRQHRGRGGGGVFFFLFLLVVLVVLLLVLTAQVVSADDPPQRTEEEIVQLLGKDALTSESVVLITGAAGFLGSELAMALHRVYNPKKILLVDSMDKGFGTLVDGQPHSIRTEQDLALFEFKRQRVFHMLQTLGAAAHLYRVDFRPSIPEFFDSSEVPVLNHIFEDHPDLSHVVHFADHYHHGQQHEYDKETNQQAVPRLKGQPKSGMMEAILEQLAKYARDHQRRPPHFLYASSGDVYNYAYPTANEPNRPPFREDQPLTTPSSMTGASKMMDEILAQTYYLTEGIYSIGLRFFSIYGPWGLPGSPIFEMAERIVAGEPPLPADPQQTVLQKGPNQANTADTTATLSDTDATILTLADEVRDYLYIDDAIDAVMAAMQYRPPPRMYNGNRDESKKDPPPPIVVNVGSGKGATLRAIAKQMQVFFPGSPEVDGTPRPPETTAFGSGERAAALLGFRPRVPLKQGIETLLAWHYDRAFPYGGKPSADQGEADRTAKIASKGIVSCSRYDAECLRGTPVFPCASECSHQDQCIPTFWDDVMDYSRALTVDCEVVMYTVALESNRTVIPSTFVQVSSRSIPHVVTKRSHCNIAFVNDASPLYQTEYTQSLSHNRHAVKHGFWALVPVRITESTLHNLRLLQLLPKLSPGLFFGGRAIRRAIYCDANIIFDSIPRLLDEAAMQPMHNEIQGSTAILIGKGKSLNPFQATIHASTPQDLVQAYAYRTIRLAVIEEMAGDGFAQMVDSSFLVHALNSEDSRLFRCDVFGEVVQWNATTDRSAFEFILGLHDMWSRVIARKMGHEPWWIGDKVRSIRAKDATYSSGGMDTTLTTKLDPHHADATLHRRLQGIEPEGHVAEGLIDFGQPREHLDHNGFGVQDAIDAMFGAAGLKPIERDEREEIEGGAAAITNPDYYDDDMLTGDAEGLDTNLLPLLAASSQQDPSAYDVWMGILSSTHVRYFGRIVTMEAVGAVHVDNEGNMMQDT